MPTLTASWPLLSCLPLPYTAKGHCSRDCGNAHEKQSSSGKALNGIREVPAPKPLGRSPRVPRGRPPSSPDHDAGRLPQLGRRGCGPNPSPAPGTASRWPPIPASILSAEAEVARRRPGLEGAAWGPPDGAPALRGPPGPPGYGNVVRRRGGRARGPGWGARGHLCPRLAFSPIKTSPVFPRVLLSVSLSLHRPP